MLTDAMLQDAAAEAERFLLSIIPEDGEPHVFSKRFEQRMQRLIRRANHPILYRVMRTAVAAVLAIVTLFGTVMAVSPEARTVVVGWIKETFGIYVHYSNDPAKESAKYDYHLSVIPEGYQEIRVTKKETGKSYLYMDNSGNVLHFAYAYGDKSSNLFLKTDGYEQQEAFVNSYPADIYIAPKKNETSAIVWQDRNANVLFYIIAIAEQDELISIAEGVQQIS